MNKKPTNLDEYRAWLRTEHREEVVERSSTYYESVTSKIARDFEASDFWGTLKQEYSELDAEYRVQTGYNLWVSKDFPEVKTKPFDSFLLKTYRKNVLDNKQWPNPPRETGWLLPSDCFSLVNDLVRTTFVVKYLDGVEFLLNAMETRCKSCKLNSHPHFEARDEGYYAAHFYIHRDFEVPQINWDTKRINAEIEIQVTTQLQEVIRQLTRRHYEERRQRLTRPDKKWQWDYRSEEFIPNYLGHILHYLEGMIMEVRDKQRSQNGWTIR